MATSKRVLYTRPGGGVSVYCPTEETLRTLKRGGLWGRVTQGWLQTQIARRVASGISEGAAERLVLALAFGGLEENEAIACLAENDCRPFGTALEIVDQSQIPEDRTHRDAWRRSANGGPIWIDEMIAQQIDEHRAWRAYAKT